MSSISSSGSYKARAAVHDRFKQSNKTCIDDAKTEVARYLDESRIEDEYLDLLNWWKISSSRFKIISKVARDTSIVFIYQLCLLSWPLALEDMC